MVKKIIKAAILIAVLTGCERNDPDKQSYTSIRIDGKTYKTDVMFEDKMRITGGQELFDSDEDSFKLRIQKTMHYGSEDISILLRIIDDEAISIGRKYCFPSSSTSLDDYSTAMIASVEDGIKKYYYALEGWLELDDITEVHNDHDSEFQSTSMYYKINGRFAFTAKEEHSGKVVEVTEGTFHNTMFVVHAGVTIAAGGF